MDKNLVNYIFEYYSNLMSAEEKLAFSHYSSQIKHPIEIQDHSSAMYRLMKKKGLITEDKELLKLLKNGIDYFKEVAVSRILSESSDKVFFNNCPNCGKLTRTPLAKQCRFCGFDWHDKS